MNFYLNSRNEYIKNEYKKLKKVLITTILYLNQINENKFKDIEISNILEEHKILLEEFKLNSSNKIDELIRNELITSKMATSLINDSTTIHNRCENLLEIAYVLFVNDKEFKESNKTL